jgi:hypothetical protein
MRCPKCGRTSFDHMDSCEKCGRDLSETRLQLGGFPKPDGGLNWLEVVAGAEAGSTEATDVVRKEGTSHTVDLSAIDVTDLIGDEDKPRIDDYAGEIDTAALEAAAEDKKFQAALGQLLGDK